MRSGMSEKMNPLFSNKPTLYSSNVLLWPHAVQVIVVSRNDMQAVSREWQWRHFVRTSPRYGYKNAKKFVCRPRIWWCSGLHHYICNIGVRGTWLKGLQMVLPTVFTKLNMPHPAKHGNTRNKTRMGFFFEGPAWTILQKLPAKKHCYWWRLVKNSMIFPGAN